MIRPVALTAFAAILAGAPACGRIGYDPVATDGIDAGTDVPQRSDRWVASGDAPPAQVWQEDAADDDAGDDDAGESSSGGALCQVVVALGSAPAIDGELEPTLALRELRGTAWTGSRSLPARASVAIAWRPNGLYVFAELPDDELRPSPLADQPACGDAFEIFIDSDGTFAAAPAYDRPGTARVVVRAPGATLTPAVTVYRPDRVPTSLPSGTVAARARPTGWVVEALIDGVTIGVPGWALDDHQQIGLDLAHDVSRSDDVAATECGERLGRYFLRVDRAEPDAARRTPDDNVRAFCTPKLQPQ